MRYRASLAALGFALAAFLSAAPASSQSCTGRFVNPIADVCWECLFPDLDRAGPHRRRLRRAGHAEPGIADLLLRLAHPAHRALARGVGAGQADGRDPHPLVLPQPRRA